MEKTLNTWASLSSHYIGECFDLAKPYLDNDYDGIDPYVRFVNAQLFIDCNLSSESSLLLIKEGKEWDAEIINRSVMEGTIKYVFLMLGNPDEVKQKAFEYWEQLPNYESIKHHDHASEILNAIDDADSTELIPFKKLILTDDEIEKYRNGSNRNERKQLQQKWSFSGITKSFLTNETEGLKLLVHLAHGYSMSSHLIHKDGDGVGMVWERYRREEIDKIAVKMAHCARIVSDICSFSRLRLHQLLKYCSIDTNIIKDIEKKHQFLFEDLKKAGNNFTEIEYKDEFCK